jgi:hypothetical protein
MPKASDQPKAGDTVILRVLPLRVLPPWVDRLPEEGREVFRFCVCRAFSVTETDHNGLLILDVSADVDTMFGGYMNDIRVEPEYVVKVEGDR